MKVTVMTDAKVKKMIDRIQRASIAVKSDGLRMVIAQSLWDENKAEGQGEVDKGDSEVKGTAQRAEIDYLLAKPRLAEAPDAEYSTVVQCTSQDRSPTGSAQWLTLPIPSTVDATVRMRTRERGSAGT